MWQIRSAAGRIFECHKKHVRIAFAKRLNGVVAAPLKRLDLLDLRRQPSESVFDFLDAARWRVAAKAEHYHVPQAAICAPRWRLRHRRSVAHLRPSRKRMCASSKFAVVSQAATARR